MKKMITRIYVSFLMCFNAILFCSCGDESTKVVKNETLDYESYETATDLPDCTDENEGSLIWIERDSQMRICDDERWYVLKTGDDSGDSDFNFSCYTKMSKDSSGYSVICNGDSIGFVHNGIAYENNGKKDKECSLLFVNGDTLEIACDSLASFFVRDSSGKLVPKELDLDEEQVALELESIGGFSQKGPLVTGSEVVAYELQNGRTLKQTGISFQGRISNDKGEFNIRSVKLTSQYAYLVAKGVYLNEVTGQKSDAQIQLNAITDLRNRNSANINILTHLEYERVAYLVTKKKMMVAEAKKQAQKEIFDIFHIDSEKFTGRSEDLTIGGTSEADAALLAISVMLQGDGRTADLSKLLNSMSSSIVESGVCDSSVLSNIADWAAKADSSNAFEQIRENVKNLGLSSKVADFEKHIRHFWNEEYGLGQCDSLGKMASAKYGRYKDSYERFVCEEKYGSRNWRIATTLETDVLNFKSAADGALDTGASGNVYVFDSSLAVSNGLGWRLAEHVEMKYGGCRKEIAGKIVRDTLESMTAHDVDCYNQQFTRSFDGDEPEYDLQHYWCDFENHKWSVVDNCEMLDTYGWKSSTDGAVKYGDSVGTSLYGNDYSPYYSSENGKYCYVYDSLDGKWRSAVFETCDKINVGCTKARIGKVIAIDEYGVRVCMDDLNVGYAYLDAGENILDVDCEPWVTGIIDNNRHYVCDNGNWRNATKMEENVGEPCFDHSDTTYSKNSEYACFTGVVVNDFFRKILPGWKKVSDLSLPKTQKEYLNDELTYGTITDSRDNRVYETIKIGKDEWFAENLLYLNVLTMHPSESCYGDNTSGCEMWRVYNWSAAMNLNGTYLSSSAQEVLSKQHSGICPEGWHVPSVEESEALLAAAGSFGALLSAKRNVLPSKDREQDTYEIYTGLYYQRGSNSSGFSGVVGAGAKSLDVNYSSAEIDTNFVFDKSDSKICWWTSAEISNTDANVFCASLDEDQSLIEIRSKEDELPVRCVKDKTEEE